MNVNIEGESTGENPVFLIQDKAQTEEADAVRSHIVDLLKGVRGLAIGIVLLFVVFGVAGVALLGSINDTRTTTKNLAREQHIALCDLYMRLERVPPEELHCR